MPCCRTGWSLARGPRPRRACLQLRLGQPDGRRQGLDVERAMVTLAVDEERRRARDPAEVGRLDVPGHSGLEGVALQVVVETLDVEPELVGVAHQVLARQRVLP